VAGAESATSLAPTNLDDASIGDCTLFYKAEMQELLRHVRLWCRIFRTSGD
jgi:hypothetical protein